jgi:catechol 2,3-dioxygenase-like lactoylglutathione lyase family enzyme
VARVSISIDVPSLARGIRFYTEAFGFEKAAEPAPGVAVLRGAGIQISLLTRREGTEPTAGSEEQRHYQRHWTPVHLDIHVENLQAALARAIAAGARREQLYEGAEHGSAVFCSDPFGHGFCLIEKRKQAV